MDRKGLSEFLKFCPNNDIPNCDDNYFTHERILALINFYKTYKVKVSKGEIKNMKRLWEMVAMEMSNLYKITVSASKCENKIKVLDRNYKKVVDNNNKSGRGSKTFPYEKEFDEIYGKKKNLQPLILLSSNSCVLSPQQNVGLNVIDNLNESVNKLSSVINEPATGRSENIIHIPDKENSHEEIPSCSHTSTSQGMPPKSRRKILPYKRRNDVLVEMKNDLKEYYNEKLRIDKEKIEISKKKLSERELKTQIMEELTAELKEYNENFRRYGGPVV